MRIVGLLSLFVVALATALAGYTSACDSNDCAAAGGHCVLGAVCAIHGSQTCGSGGPPNPGFHEYCCLADTADCGQPSAITYACPPLEGGAAGEVSIRLSHQCKAGPPKYTSIYDFEADDDGGSDASYPLYCTATLPVCSNGQPVSCTCGVGDRSGSWSCNF